MSDGPKTTEQLNTPEAIAMYREPQYIDEVEALLGVEAFSDERQEQLYDDFSSLSATQELGSRALIYTSSLRVLAISRAEDRRLIVADESPSDVRTWNERWRPSVKRIDLISRLASVDVRPLARQLIMINNLESFLERELDETSILRESQHPFLRSIVGFLQAGPSPVTVKGADGMQTTKYTHGATVDAPTGIGKTVLMARTVTGLGIGMAPEGAARHEEHLRALIIVPTQQLVQQFCGETGDDTFRRFAPDAKVSAFYQYEKDLSADVVVTTIDHFTAHFRDGHLNGERFDIGFIDEVHHLNEPKFQNVFHEHWQGPVIGFTGTAAYSEDRDVRRILPHVIYHGDTLKYIKDGVLNAAQLLMFRVDPSRYKAELPLGMELNDYRQIREAGSILSEKGAVDLALRFIQEGRRGIIFSEYGSESESARRIARMIMSAKNADGSEMRTVNGMPIRAEALGRFRTILRDGASNVQVLDAYNEGKVDVLTSVEFGSEGLNADIDFVIIASSVTSLLKMKQLIGRGTRLSERFPTTVYAQFLTVDEGFGTTKRCTIFEGFGLDTVEQGIRIGRRSNGTRANASIVDVDTLPRELFEKCMVIDGRPVAEASVAGEKEVEIPDGWMKFDCIPRALHYNPIYAQRLLSNAGYKWVARYEDVDGEKVFVRYFEPEAKDFFIGRHELITNGVSPLRKVADDYDLTIPYVRKLMSENNISSVIRSTDRGRKVACLTAESLETVGRIIEAIPVAAEGDMTLAQLARETGASIQTIIDKYSPTTHYRKRPNAAGFHRFVLAEDAEVIRTQHNSVPPAKADDMTRADIAREVGMNQGEFMRLVRDEELRLAAVRRITGAQKGHMNGERMVWSHEDGMRIVERLRKRRDDLPAHLVPMRYTVDLIPVTEGAIRNTLKLAGIDMPKLRLKGAPSTNCINWETLRMLEKRYGSRPGAVKVDYDQLPIDANDSNHSRVEYARALQLLLVPVEKLGFTPDQLIAATIRSKELLR